MYLTVKQKVKHLSKEEYSILRELCHTAKNLANEAIYNVRQYLLHRGRISEIRKELRTAERQSQLQNVQLQHGTADSERSRWFV